MSFDAQAWRISHGEIVALLKAHHELQQSRDELKRSCDDLARQVAWFQRQLFGSKSERRIVDDLGH
jgi:hypothetical protein